MWIKSIKVGKACKIYHEILRWLATSRFTAEVECFDKAVKLTTIRLREKKPYCGNHPNECAFNPFRPEKKPKARYLEGADWVEWSDTLNDIADRLGMDCRIESGTCLVRDGRRRRINYGSFVQSQSMFGTHWEWERYGDRDEDCMDCIGATAPRSTFPEGTNGIYEAAGQYAEEVYQ